MLHLVPQSEPVSSPVYAEAVARLASVRHALRLVDGGFGAGPEDSLDQDIAAAWPNSSEAKQQWFDRRSTVLVGAAEAGIEALLEERHGGRVPHNDACRSLVDEIRRELRDVANIILA
ncbi:MAG TPA: hypothetical protein VE968_07485 [Sphingomicrobium sp.]|nr:hypothetical protein [Sphingomicrobium sp.]